MLFSQYHSQQDKDLAKIDNCIFWPKKIAHIIWTYQINFGQKFYFLDQLWEEDKCEY